MDSFVVFFPRIEANQMPRLFGYGPELRTFEHLAHKVKKIEHENERNEKEKN